MPDPDPVDLADGDSYVGGPPHEWLEHLRRHDPVSWQPTADGGGYWVVTRHADVIEVSRHPLRFSAELGGVVIQDLDPAGLTMMRRMLLAMDPPRHTVQRKQISGEFKARVIAGLEGRIRAICRSIMDAASERGELDFVHDVCTHLPSQVIGELMGLPPEDWAHIHGLAERNSGGQDPDIADDDEDRGKASVEMAMYAMAFAASRRESAVVPDDLTSVILATDVDGAPMSDADFGAFFVQLVTAGNDTTRTMLSSGLDALLDHRGQLERLRQDPGAIPGAIEEVLRWANPLHHFRRTATEDTLVGHTAVAAGDKVVMMYTSANRDEAVFVDPHAFDITRDPNPHLSFGIGEHFCLGVHLARLEGRVFFEELLARFPRIERTGPPRRQRSNLNNALKSLPVILA